jgi:hypothetical protein
MPFNVPDRFEGRLMRKALLADALIAALMIAVTGIPAQANASKHRRHTWRVVYTDPAWAADQGAPASTSHGGVLVSGPTCAIVSAGVGDHSVWLGHFSGGRMGPAGLAPGGVDWKNLYACFPSRQACERWERDMHAAYHRLDGYRSCVRIR